MRNRALRLKIACPDGRQEKRRSRRLDVQGPTETKPAVPPESDREQKRNLAYLVVLAGVSAGEMFKLQEDKTVVGRGPTVGVRLNDEGVSREHCQFLREGEKIIVVDLGSTNGTSATVSASIAASWPTATRSWSARPPS